MSIIDKVEDKAKGWLIGIALKKGIGSAAKLIVSYALAHGLLLNVTIGGILIDSTNEIAITAAINSGLKMLFNYLKNKYPKLAWLP